MMTRIICHTTLCLTLSCLLAFTIIGCGDGESKSPDEEQLTSTDEKSTKKKDTTSRTSSSSKQVSVDSKKGKMIGDIPYDVWFKDPIAVAGDGTQVAVTSTTTPNTTTNNTTPEMKPEVKPTPKVEPSATAGGKVDWKRVIPADVLNDEVKKTRNRFTVKLRSVGTYNKSYLEFKPFCVTLSVLAEIASVHPGELRWKKNAKIVRDLSAKMVTEKLRTGAKSYKQVLIPFEQISDTLDGSPPSGLEKPSDEDSFADVADMGDIMKRMEALAKQLKDNSGNEDSFKKYKGDLRHQAYVLAALTKALNSEGYGNSDDEVFTKYSNTMVAACVKMAVAAETEDYAAFEKAMPQINQSCIDCHTDYRN